MDAASVGHGAPPSLTRAAETLALTPSAVSHALRRLRCQKHASALAVVGASDLWLTAPARRFEIAPDRVSLQTWPLPFRLARLPIHPYRHRRHDEDAASRWLRELIAGVLRGEASAA